MSRVYDPDKQFSPPELALLYVTIRNKVQPAYVCATESTLKDWGELARLIADNHICAPHYMRWIWDFYAKVRPIVHIKMLNSADSVQLYMRNIGYTEKDRETELRIKLNIQKEVVHAELKRRRELRTVLLDETLVIGVVLRYALAYSGGLEDLVSIFCAEAEYVILFEPLYNKLLGDNLPPGTGTWNG